MRALILSYILICNVIFFFSVSLVFGESLQPRGEAFSDPGQTVEMGDEWQQQPVVHPRDIKTEILINLDQSTFPVFAGVIRQFAEKNGLNLRIHSGTCGISNRGLLKKEIDAGSFCCPPGKEDRFPGLIFHTLGISSLEVIVNPANPLENITFPQAQQLFTGEIGRWADLAPASSSYDYPVQPVAFIHCKKRPGHWRLLLDNEDLFSPRLKNVITIPDVISAVAGNKMAVSLAVGYLAHEMNRDRGEVRGVKMDDIRADDMDALVQGRYPLYRVTSIAYWQDGPHKQEVQKLLAFLDRYVEENSTKLSFVPASRLRQAGWRFNGEELIAAP